MMTVQQAYYTQPNGLVVPQVVPAGFRQQGLCLGIHGHQKQGKSSLADSGPRPVITLDVETASFWTPSRKVYWNPLRETVPGWPTDPRAVRPNNPEGYWDTCVVVTHDYDTLVQTHQILMTGQHPFNSVSVDSVTTVVQRVSMSLAGLRKMERDHWGQLLRHVLRLVMDYRDLLTHPTNPVWAVTFVFGTHFDQRTQKWRPNLQGQSQDLVPYVPDLTGWLEAYPDGSRHLWTGPSPYHETGERLWGRLPYDMQLGYPGVVDGWTVESMVQHVLAS